MSEAKFTPGPWRIWSSGMLGRGKQFIHAGKGDAPCLDKSFRCVAAIGELEMTPEESEANARLISAAPECYEAMCMFRDFLNSLPKGWLGKTVGDIGLLNDAYLMEAKASRKVKGTP